MAPPGNKKRILTIILMGAVMIIIAVFITRTLTAPDQPSRSTLQRIRDRGYLLAATDRNTLNYFIYRGDAMGYQFRLLESFSRSLGIPLRIIATNNIRELYRLLEYRAVDILALNLPVTAEGKAMARMSKAFGDTRLVLVQRARQTGKGSGTSHYIKALNDFSNDTLYVRDNPFMEPLYMKMELETGGRLVLKKISGKSTEELVRMVSGGEISYTVCEENLARVMIMAYPDIDASLALTRLYPYAWAMSRHTDSLKVMLNQWIDSARKEKVLKKNVIEYYGSERTASFFKSGYSSLTSTRLSPYDQEMKTLSRLIWWDWRLIASLMYEESNFLGGKVSSRNASGLMQLVPETAEKYGLDSTSGPGHQIAAGIKYLKWIDKQLPADITDPMERVSFILASYNVGIGRVMSLRRKAAQFGKDTTRWHGNVEYYLLKRSKQDPFGHADSLNDFPINYNTEGYVDGIISRYYNYRNLIPY